MQEMRFLFILWKSLVASSNMCWISFSFLHFKAWNRRFSSFVNSLGLLRLDMIKKQEFYYLSQYWSMLNKII